MEMFTHLHAHSYYSFLDGLLSPLELVELASKNRMKSIALTDHDGLTGAIEFYDACHEFGIKPILGLEILVNHPYGIGNLILLAKNFDGWSNLCQLSSLKQCNSIIQSHNGISFDKLFDHSSGLICLSGGKRGLVNNLLLKNLDTDAIGYLDHLNAFFKGDLYIEIQYQNPPDISVIQKMITIGNKIQIPLVATNNVHYSSDSKADLQRTICAIRNNIPISRIPSWIPAPIGCSFTTQAEMMDRFKEIPEAILNTIKISEKCNLSLQLGLPRFPKIKLPTGETDTNLLKKLVIVGAKRKYGDITQDIHDRLDYELDIIHKKGYSPLFLIVKDIIDFARKNDIPVSSRGSAASSLVSYCLDITFPEPIGLNLYFERFLNPARSTPPDIDTDICSKNRDRVIQYVFNKYGNDRVAMVATIIRFQHRSALREVAKAHGLSNEEIAKLLKSISARRWDHSVRTRTYNEPYLELKSKLTDTKHNNIITEATAILGFPRHLSVHPGGIIICPVSLTDLVPIHLAAKGVVTTQFDLKSIERFGLVKMDLLGTRGLAVLGDVAKKVHKWRSTEYKTDLHVLESIPERDQKTQAILHSTETIGCFAIESPGMRTTLREINAKTINDIMIALALYRPGPMTGGLKDTFIKRHLGKEKVTHIHPALTKLLENTHGVILYQEQVLRIASQLAGLSLTDSDLLRRAMSHFDPGEQMKTLKSKFIQGAKERSEISEDIGEQLWDLMAAFAGYGFPKAHAASYALVAWRSIWCKAHFPAEFMSAVLANGGGYYRQFVYINEARRLGIEISPPHINHSQVHFSTTYPLGKPRLYMGLDQVRDLSRATIKRILKNRPFTSLFDFLTRVDPKLQEAENLIKVGALQGLGKIPVLLSQVKADSWRYGQPRLFHLDVQNNSEDDWDIETRYSIQKELLGIGVDAHPVELISDRLNTFNIIDTVQASEMIGGKAQLVGIKQTSQRYHSHELGFYFQIELDNSRSVFLVRMSRELFNRNRRLLSSIHPFIVEGTIRVDSSTDQIFLDARKVMLP